MNSKEKNLRKLYNFHQDTFSYFDDFKRQKDIIKIKCNICFFIFKKQMINHMKISSVCPECYKLKNKYFLTYNQIKERCYNIHLDTYIYPDQIYKGTEHKIKIICKKHGEFKQRAQNHMQGQGCPSCKSSIGENIIENYLIKHSIKYEKEFKFTSLKQLRFDFYLIDYKICVEYDGIQHFQPSRFGSKCTIEESVLKFEKQKINDNLKNKYCLDNNIKLCRIKYTEIKNIQKILKDLK